MMVMQHARMGWIGTGKMGLPMATHLLNAGNTLSFYNRTGGKGGNLISGGAIEASSPAAVADNAEVIFLMIPDDAAVQAVFEGNNGLFSTTLSGKLIINMSTVSAAINRKMAEACNVMGADYLDAPVSGSVKQATEATLVIMCGGSKTAFERAKPLLELMGKLVLHVGDAGAGNYAKLAVNTLLGIVTQGFAETLVFAESLGIKQEDFISIINNSAMASPYLKIKGEVVTKQDFTAAFLLSHIAKDLGLAKQSGYDLPLGNTAHATFHEALADYGDKDLMAVIEYLRKSAANQ